MGFCSCSSKVVIVIINLLFWLGAAFMIYGGVSYLSGGHGVEDHVSKTPAYVAFGIAGVLFLSGLMGIAGAFSEKKFFLGMFAVLALAGFAILLFVTISMFVSHEKVMNQTDTFAAKQFNNYGNPNLTESGFLETAVMESTTSASSGSGNATTSAPDTNVTTTTATSTTTMQTTTAAPSPDVNATKFIDEIQKSLECCGFNNYSDWNSYDYWIHEMGKTGYVPQSCCNETAAGLMNATCQDRRYYKVQSNLIYTDACKEKIHIVVDVVYYFMNYAALAFAILVLLGFVASIYLMCRKRSSDGFNYSSIVA